LTLEPGDEAIVVHRESLRAQLLSLIVNSVHVVPGSKGESHSLSFALFVEPIVGSSHLLELNPGVLAEPINAHVAQVSSEVHSRDWQFENLRVVDPKGPLQGTNDFWAAVVSRTFYLYFKKTRFAAVWIVPLMNY
jgi:hypothetical protein